MGSFFTKYLMKFGQSEKNGTLGLLRCFRSYINSGSMVHWFKRNDRFGDDN